MESYMYISKPGHVGDPDVVFCLGILHMRDRQRLCFPFGHSTRKKITFRRCFLKTGILGLGLWDLGYPAGEY